MIVAARPLLIALAAAGGVCGAFAGSAQAAPATARLETTAAPGAGDCPDASALAANVNEGLGRPALVTAGAAPPSPRRIAVSFERAGNGYAATVHIGGAQGGTRKLSNAGPGCRALADAVGMLLVLVLDSNDDAAAGTLPGPQAGLSAASGAVSATGATGATGRRSALTAAVGASAGVADGVVGGWSPAVGLGGTLTYGALSARLGGFWLPAKSHQVGQGRVEVGLAAARLALCATAHRDRAVVGLGLCVQQQAGWIHGRGVGYDDNHTAGHLWLATGAAIVVNGPLARTVGWEVDAGIVRLWQETRFVVGNVGTAFQSPPVAFMATLSFATRVW